MTCAAPCFFSDFGPDVLSSCAPYYQHLKWRMLPAFRRQRMRRFLRIMQPQTGARILDVGGLPALNGIPGFWQDHSGEFRITLLNLPGAFDGYSEAELAPYRLIEADACKCGPLSETFDIVFSNALIEHVGNARRQQGLANFIRSAGDAFWVQTPAPLFPIEAHCDLPFWWFMPMDRRRRQITTWNRGEHRFLAQQMASTRPIWAKQLRQLFPDSKLMTEYFLGLPKSQIAYRPSRR